MAAADPADDGASWYAVRCVFLWDRTDLDERPEGATYEERLTLWRATSLDEAVARAETEAVVYAGENGHRYLRLAQCYRLDADAGPADGDEVFSLLRDSPLGADAYLDRHFDTGGEHQGTGEG
ncbi:hypothetical protein ABZY31_28720 [Streptomyces sp. NPDC006529]|uniref:hypothetical protein n=1 Tax=Streptomyces sp. NPDC006529 TaxID=3157177 RepID=UPI0033A6F5BB